jgi:(1->4)-alpha-D-glucan 1-alpha-D-glucosylmutase
MQIPLATYRIQFNPGFGFGQARKIVSYLHDLGISHLYASPIFKARRASDHGYDVVDPNQLNPELGTLAEFEDLLRAIKNHHMGWLQDIVPNHMAYDGANPWLADLFENGPLSQYYRFFDIDWDHRHPDLRGKVLAPFLGREAEQCFEDREVRLEYGANGFFLVYFNHALPLKAETYQPVLARMRARLAAHHQKPLPDVARLDAIMTALEKLPGHPKPKQRRRHLQEAKAALWRLHNQSPQIRRAMADTLISFNHGKDDPQSRPLADALLPRQVFALSFWKTAARKINYRRFFAINELIAVRQESTAVFNQTHALLLKLVRKGWFSGLRLDHIDGLTDPLGYLERLRKEVHDIYLVVEKILSPEEWLPAGWPVQGTTGYDFAGMLNGLFCQREHAGRFDDEYRLWSGDAPAYEEQVYHSKAQFLEQEMAGDLDNLARLIQKASAGVSPARALSLDRLRPALTAFLAAFPVYRTYIGGRGPDRQARRFVRQAATTATIRRPSLKNEIRILHSFLLKPPGGGPDPGSKAGRAIIWKAVQRLQQLAAPAAAKGVEDTALYRYHRLISLNEVGGQPSQFGCPLEHFHDFIARRLKKWPHSMNGSSTHDSKRSEDVRARINVLSELPDRWHRQVQSWRLLNQDLKIHLDGRRVPDSHTEYFIYQTLVGACPLDPERLPGFAERMVSYVVKAAREAKTRTSWIDPDPAHETALTQFIRRLLAPLPKNPFLKQFLPFLEEVVHFGIFNMLSQSVIKITAPGVPDFYQGTELPTFSLVDPDNRRPVDFVVRKRWLELIRARHKSDPLALIADLMEDKLGGRIKLFLIYAALQARRRHHDLFQRGQYLPLAATGRRSVNVVAFARRYAKTWSLTLAPRFLTGLIESRADPLGSGVWGDTICRLPPGAPRSWTDAFTTRTIEAGGFLKVGDVLHHFPVALLTGGAGP